MSTRSKLEPEVLSGVNLPAVETNPVERLVFQCGLQKTVCARLPRGSLRLIERQAVGIDAWPVRSGHQLQIEAAPAPWPEIGDDLDHREPQKPGGRGHVEMPGAAVVDFEHGRSWPADFFDQHDWVVPSASAAGGQQAPAAGTSAERHAGGRPGFRTGIPGDGAEQGKANEMARAAPGSLDHDRRPRSSDPPADLAMGSEQQSHHPRGLTPAWRRGHRQSSLALSSRIRRH